MEAVDLADDFFLLLGRGPFPGLFGGGLHHGGDFVVVGFAGDGLGAIEGLEVKGDFLRGEEQEVFGSGIFRVQADDAGAGGAWGGLDDVKRVAEGAQAVADEVRSIVRELADLLRANRAEIRLVDQCALDVPELARAWYLEGRVKIVEQLAVYLERRSAAGRLPASADPLVQARIVLETLVMWTVHRLGDPMPQEIDEDAAHRMLIDFTVRGLLGDAAARGEA